MNRHLILFQNGDRFSFECIICNNFKEAVESALLCSPGFIVDDFAGVKEREFETEVES